MTTERKNARKARIYRGLGALILTFGLLPTASAQVKTNHYGTLNSPQMHAPYAQPALTNGARPYIQQPYTGPMHAPQRAQAPRSRYGATQYAAGYAGLVHGIRPVISRPVHGFQQWVDYEPEYRIQPGDQLDIVVSSAPELSRTLTVGPDGRIIMPMAQPVMAAGRTFGQVTQNLSAQLGKQLRDPTVAITPRAYSPSQVFVGGEVTQPGTYALPGPVGAIEAIFMAGGFRNSAKTRHIAVLRRAPNGGMMIRTVDIGGGLRGASLYNDTVQLRRGDIVFVPRTTLAEVGLFMQALRDAIPVDFNVSYQLGLDGNNGEVIPTTP